MRPRPVFLLAALAVAGAAVPAVSVTMAPFYSSTRAFSLDGERYTLARSEEGDFSLVRRELERSGVRVPPFENDPPPHPALAFRLRAEGPHTPRWRTPLPACLETRHSLALLSAGGPVEVSFGASTRQYDASRRRLEANGWKCEEMGARGTRRCVATRSSGKETSLVFLEEEEGAFLVVRRLER